ncbi:tRNA 4-thiouridine(8) synthase ThiI [Desulfosarcina sp. OttesenSCG-928-A07]|nr:tRNA 4-thiouridine(8) synthase ThiI [Desulfosarcina sp. OttesenSCG-928-G17]MDL2328436.1 tRNA 4-thiouridine(8) synthase ThiI [Desulfosarcina sp. OttesenSCG-928-A07]
MTEFNAIFGLGLCSGGLDSILSALVLRDQGLNVHWVAFETPFFSAANAKKAARQTGISLRVENITDVYMEMLRSPSVRYGKNMNPCMDCHALMFRLAGEIMRKNGFHFLFSGEVLGQRPMSQNRTSLRYVEKQSGFDGYILRPLSAKCLPETLAEQNGWVNREKLLDISGRSRKPQMELARHYGITDFPAPAGGCLLTDKMFSQRLRDLLAHQADADAAIPERTLHLLKFGRHLRLDTRTKIIVGRTQKDNEMIQQNVDLKQDQVLKVKNYPGPLVVIPGKADDAIQELAARICAGYSKAPENMPVTVSVCCSDGDTSVTVLGLPPSESRQYLIG